MSVRAESRGERTADSLLVAQPVVEASTIGDLLILTAGAHPDREAFVSPYERRTYRELLENARQISAGLIALGISPGERIGLFAPVSAAFVEACFGAVLCGAVPVPISTRFRSAELQFVLKDAAIAVLMMGGTGSGAFVERLDGVVTASRRGRLSSWGPRHMVLLDDDAPVHEDYTTRSELLAEAAGVDDEELELRRAAVRLRDLGWMLYTSGTSSNPKGVLLTHESLGRASCALGSERFRLVAGDRVWIPLPMYHVAGVAVLLASVASASTLMTMATFDGDQALAMLEQERATVIYPAFPNVVHALIGHPRFAATDLSAIRLMINVGSASVLREFQRAFPSSVQISGFGLTETSGLVVLGDIDDDEDTRVESCGLPFRGVEVKAVDEQRREVAAGQPGELAIRGYCVFEGYQGLPQRTREVLDEEGWFYSGDRGSVDADGRVRFLGRIKDMFKVGGENVGAAEVEAFLNTHAAIKVSQVVGVPDDRLGAVPAAFVELREGAALTAEELIEHCRTRIASYKVPRHIRFVAEWPMSTTKIQKFRLRERLLDELDLTEPDAHPKTQEKTNAED